MAVRPLCYAARTLENALTSARRRTNARHISAVSSPLMSADHAPFLTISTDSGTTTGAAPPGDALLDSVPAALWLSASANIKTAIRITIALSPPPSGSSAILPGDEKPLSPHTQRYRKGVDEPSQRIVLSFRRRDVGSSIRVAIEWQSFTDQFHANAVRIGRVTVGTALRISRRSSPRGSKRRSCSSSTGVQRISATQRALIRPTCQVIFFKDAV